MLIDWLAKCPTYRLTNVPTDWLVGWLADWLAGWLAGRLADWLAGWMDGWMDGCLAGWLADWLADVTARSDQAQLLRWRLLTDLQRWERNQAWTLTLVHPCSALLCSALLCFTLFSNDEGTKLEAR